MADEIPVIVPKVDDEMPQQCIVVTADQAAAAAAAVQVQQKKKRLCRYPVSAAFCEVIAVRL